MFYSLRLEAIGDNILYESRMCKKHGIPFNIRRGIDIPRRPWVAKLAGKHANGQYIKIFMRGQKDYTYSNGTGSRGIYIFYSLDNGIYEINELINWKKTKRYFLRVKNGMAEQVVRKKEVCHG